jgi:YD repeat-containing protein
LEPDRLRDTRFLVRDRDAKFSWPFDEVFRTEDVRVIRTPVRAPKANAYAERWVRAVRRECLDHILIIGRRDLDRVLREYGFGQVASVTKLAGTPQAVTTQYTYEPVFKQLDTITDPLNHVTDFDYDAKGCLDTITDGAMRTTSFDCNSAGQITSVTNARNKTTSFAYSNGDLKTVSDPLGRVSSRFTDAGVRVTAVTDPLNYVTRNTYDNLNQLTKVTDAAGGTSPWSTTRTGTSGSSATSGAPRRARPSSRTTTRTSSRPGSIHLGGARASRTTTTGIC